MAVGACTHSIIVVLHNDGLLAGIPAGEKDHHLPGLQEQAGASAGGAAAQAVRKHKMQGAAHLQELDHVELFSSRPLVPCRKKDETGAGTRENARGS
jgi:hypothetical protein